jgi:hypothetical protein
LSKNQKTDLDLARDDLMSHIHRCGVLKALPEHQMEWLEETIEYLGECYPQLSAEQLTQLKDIGVRFCQPVIPHGRENTALSVQQEAAPASRDEGETKELAGV